MPSSIVFDTELRRVFVDSARGCPGGCLYCYLPDFGVGSRAIPTDAAGEDIAQALLRHESFVPGRHGTLISFGHMSDPLLAPAISKTLEILEQLLPLGNPIQIASKCFAGNEHVARRIAAWQLYPGQFMLNVSITSFRYAHILEPHAPAPRQRLNVMGAFERAGLSTCLIIKPLIPGVTNRELDCFQEIINAHGISFCIVGVLYASQAIIDQLKRSVPPELLGDTLDSFQPTSARIFFPNDHARVLDQSSNLALQQFVVERLKQTTAARIFKTSSCALAHRLGISDPLQTWRRTPELCVACQDCEGLAQACYDASRQ